MNEARLRQNGYRTPTDGKPYYCTFCGMGWNEYGACDEFMCKLESAAEAQARFVHEFEGALERIALLDEADGHELTREHALRAVAIATSTLGKHPSEILARTNQYDPAFVEELKRADAAPPEAEFSNVEEMLEHLNGGAVAGTERGGG